MWFRFMRKLRTIRRPVVISRARRRLEIEAIEERVVPTSVSNVGELISAINAANLNGGDTINMTPGTYSLTTVDNSWYGPDALPAISSPIVIHGDGAVLQYAG
jgi:hypothetical protein